MNRAREPSAGRASRCALGGGGARGYAHIGDPRGPARARVRRRQHRRQLDGRRDRRPVRRGGLDAYADWVRGLTHRDVLRLYDPRRRAPGAIRAEKIFARWPTSSATPASRTCRSRSPRWPPTSRPATSAGSRTAGQRGDPGVGRAPRLQHRRPRRPAAGRRRADEPAAHRPIAAAGADLTGRRRLRPAPDRRAHPSARRASTRRPPHRRSRAGGLRGSAARRAAEARPTRSRRASACST